MADIPSASFDRDDELVFDLGAQIVATVSESASGLRFRVHGNCIHIPAQLITTDAKLELALLVDHSSGQIKTTSPLIDIPVLDETASGEQKRPMRLASSLLGLAWLSMMAAVLLACALVPMIALFGAFATMATSHN